MEDKSKIVDLCKEIIMYDKSTHIIINGIPDALKEKTRKPKFNPFMVLLGSTIIIWFITSIISNSDNIKNVLIVFTLYITLGILIIDNLDSWLNSGGIFVSEFTYKDFRISGIFEKSGNIIRFNGPTSIYEKNDELLFIGNIYCDGQVCDLN